MERDLRTIKVILLIFGGIVIVYLLHILATLLIPLALALFIAILLQPILAWFERKRWPFSLSLTAISITTLSFLALFGTIFYQTGLSIAEEKDVLLAQINTKLDGIFAWVNSLPGIDLKAEQFTEMFTNIISSDWLLKSSGVFAGILGDFTGTFFMTALYLIAFLGGILKYEQYIRYLEEGNASKQDNLLQSFEQVKTSITTYIKIKFFVSFLTGLGFALACWLFGINFAIFWGFLAFILNFIPTVGSIMATIPPIALGLVQLDGTGVVFLLLAILALIQVIFGNIVEPRLMGSSLSLNTVAVILGLVFWGYIWGITGMILSVPLLVLVKVILTQFPEATILVRLMGASGVNSNEE